MCSVILPVMLNTYNRTLEEFKFVQTVYSEKRPLPYNRTLEEFKFYSS